MSAGQPRSLSALPELSDVELRALDRARGPAAARVAPGHAPHGQLRYLWTDGMPDGFERDDGAAEPCPDIEVLSLPDVELRSDWMPYHQGEVITDARLYPPYVRHYYATGTIDLFGYPAVERVRRINHPVWVVSHFNMRTYGHFLLEVLPKLLLVAELYRFGLNHAVAMPASRPALVDIARAACPELRLLIYDDHRERLLLRRALLPSLLLSRSSHLHDLTVASVKRLAFRAAAGRPADRRVFLSRRGVRSFRTLANEAELAEIAAGYGFVTVRPETLPWAEQVRLFATASHVVGEFSSALHNTLFCPASAKVVGLNWYPGVQSAIAACVGHEVGYLLPKDSVRTDFRDGWTETQPFEIEPAAFRDRLEQIGLKRV